MSQDLEASFPIEDFNGINRNIDREDLGPTHYYASKNLWEKKIGVLETRGGSSAFAILPSNIIKTMDNFKLYKNDGTKVRIAAVQNDPDVTGLLGSLPAGFAVSLVTQAGAYWSHNTTLGGQSWGGTPDVISIRFVGHGVDKWHDLTYTSISGYSAGQTKS